MSGWIRVLEANVEIWRGKVGAVGKEDGRDVDFGWLG